MNAHIFKTIARARRLSQVRFASLAGVTRQAVSLWFKEVSAGKQDISVRLDHMLRLSKALSLKVEDLVEPLPLLGDERVVKELRATFLWDQLYPTLEDFLIAGGRGELRALARFVQVLGMFRSARILGPLIWRKFGEYEKYLHPIRREECERIWKLQEDLGWR